MANGNSKGNSNCKYADERTGEDEMVRNANEYTAETDLLHPIMI